MPISSYVGGVNHTSEHTSACTPKSAIWFSLMVLRFPNLGSLLIVEGRDLSPTQPSLQNDHAAL